MKNLDIYIDNKTSSIYYYNSSSSGVNPGSNTYIATIIGIKDLINNIVQCSLLFCKNLNRKEIKKEVKKLFWNKINYLNYSQSKIQNYILMGTYYYFSKNDNIIPIKYYSNKILYNVNSNAYTIISSNSKFLAKQQNKKNNKKSFLLTCAGNNLVNNFNINSIIDEVYIDSEKESKINPILDDPTLYSLECKDSFIISYVNRDDNDEYINCGELEVLKKTTKIKLFFYIHKKIYNNFIKYIDL